ncbi:MAG: hypothetical protein JSV45_06785 [Chromatiales bacterium]|nr:MAG: hypothetical protein JSV45_06785 [Chromatiales bacterium]
MSRFATWCIHFISGVAVVIGAILVSWESVTIYYLISGRIQARDEHPPLGLAATLFAIGMALLVGGYIARRSSAARLAAEARNPDRRA